MVDYYYHDESCEAFILYDELYDDWMGMDPYYDTDEVEDFNYPEEEEDIPDFYALQKHRGGRWGSQRTDKVYKNRHYNCSRETYTVNEMWKRRNKTRSKVDRCAPVPSRVTALHCIERERELDRPACPK